MSTLTHTRLHSILRRPSLRLLFFNTRLYSFESGRKPKSGPSLDPDPEQLSPTNNNESGDSKPIVITGRGRRLNHRSSSPSIPCPSTPKLALPFKPLSANHLAHLRPTTLFLDLFFSLQRPLLEIEISPSQRRSITAETKQSKLGLESNTELESPLEQEDHAEDTYLGSPSDPAFKQPHPSTARTPLDDNEFEDQDWSTSDPYSSFLITEPEGVHPAWSDALKRCLATSQAFQPPPLPKRHIQEIQLSRNKRTVHSALPLEAEQSQASFKAEQEIQLDLDRKQALSFLAPYGLTSHIQTTFDLNHQRHSLKTQIQNSCAPSNDKKHIFQSELSQDPLSLTIQAARFLHSVTVANRWPIAANWTAIESKLAAAEEAYKKDAPTPASITDDISPKKEDSSFFPPIRGSERPIHSGRRNRSTHNSIQWIHVRADNDQYAGRRISSTISLKADQLKEIIKYSHQILNQKIQLDSIPRSILKSLERFGEFLIQKKLIENLNRSPNKSSVNNLVKDFTHFHNNKSRESTSLPPSISIDPPSLHLHNHQSEDKSDAIVELDSVFRKKKRKMKVHKYKKRRKARRTLRKRQGKS